MRVCYPLSAMTMSMCTCRISSQSPLCHVRCLIVLLMSRELSWPSGTDCPLRTPPPLWCWVPPTGLWTSIKVQRFTAMSLTWYWLAYHSPSISLTSYPHHTPSIPSPPPLLPCPLLSHSCFSVLAKDACEHQDGSPRPGGPEGHTGKDALRGENRR